MHFFTYILESESTGKLYIGQTSNLTNRIERHNNGGNRYTKGKGPWKLLGLKKFPTRQEAIQLENQLKKFKSPKRVRDWIKENCNI